MRVLQPKDWPKPSGYANGVEASGRMVFVAGQVGWDPAGRFEPDLVAQVRQTLANVVAVLAEAGAGPEHVTRMTWYILDKQEYARRTREIGAVYRELMGRNYPAMAMVQVSALMEDDALVEIEATAVVPDAGGRAPGDR